MRGVVSPLVKLLIFLVVTAILTYVLGATISNSSYGAAKLYKADFTDASGLQLGDDVRIAGVRVGVIDSIAIKHPDSDSKQSYAQVGFTVQKSRPLSKSVTAYLRYRNLVGQRYLDIEQGAGDDNSVLSSDDVLPLSQTHPAVDLTVLFAGFEPLVQGLDPDELNDLSLEVIQTLQGEGGALASLLAHTASLTNALADKDKVIGEVIDNLTGVLQALGNKDDELRSLIIELSDLFHGLADDRKTIGNSLDGINKLTTSTAGLLQQVRPPLAGTVKDLTGLVALLNKNEPTVKYVLQNLPTTLGPLIRTATYGSWFNFYLCSVTGNVTLGPLKLDSPSALGKLAGLANGSSASGADGLEVGGDGGRCQ